MDIIYLVEDNKNLIEYKNNQIIIISTELKNGIYKLIQDNNSEGFDEKDLIKVSVRKALKLKSSDVIVIKQDHIFIKVFNEAKKNETVYDVIKFSGGLRSNAIINSLPSFRVIIFMVRLGECKRQLIRAAFYTDLLSNYFPSKK